LRANLSALSELAPHSLESVALFSLMTRFTRRHDLENLTLRIYEGKGSSETDGMSGIDPRYVMNKIAACLVKNQGKVVDATDLLRDIADGLSELTSITPAHRTEYLEMINFVKQHYVNLVGSDVREYLTQSDRTALHADGSRYLIELDKVASGTHDEEVMRIFEEKLRISEAAKRSFREELSIKIAFSAEEGSQSFDLFTHPVFSKAIDRLSLTNLADLQSLSNNEGLADYMITHKNYTPNALSKAFSHLASLSSHADSFVKGR
jgi:serine protein kinase